jgi:chromosome segregation ATPase
MAKKNNRGKDLPQGNTKTVEKSADKVKLEKLIPVWSSALENASKTYLNKRDSLDIKFDQDFLKALIKEIPEDKANEFKTWVQSFSDTCKELDKYQHNLEEECKLRWNSCNEQGQRQQAKESALREQEAELKKKQNDIELQASEISEKEQEVSSRDSQLVINERDLNARELNASQGFSQQNRKALDALESDQKELERTFQNEMQKVKAERTALKDEIRDAERQLDVLRNTRSEEEYQRISELENREYNVSGREQAIKEQVSRVERERRDLK